MSASKAKGTSAETAVVKYLLENGFPDVERRALQGAKDKGDIAGIPRTVVEVKAAKRLELSEWLKELAEEIQNANAENGVLVVKRPRRGDAADWYAVMPFSEWVRLIQIVLSSSSRNQIQD